MQLNIIMLMAEIGVLKIHNPLCCTIPACPALRKGSSQQLFLLPCSVGIYWCKSVLSAVSALLQWVVSEFWDNLTSLQFSFSSIIGGLTHLINNNLNYITQHFSISLTPLALQLFLRFRSLRKYLWFKATFLFLQGFQSLWHDKIVLMENVFK